MYFLRNGRRAVPPPAPPAPNPAVSQLPVSGQQPVGFETVLGANSVMEGVLKSSANVRLDGTFTGTLEITGNVLVGETARINADIHARNVSIAGAVRGNVSGKKVQLLRTGRIWGDIRAQALTTEEGAFIDGKITMISKDPPADEQQPAENSAEAAPADRNAPADAEPAAEIVAAIEQEEAGEAESETASGADTESGTAAEAELEPAQAVDEDEVSAERSAEQPQDEA